jgi:hypothetical protein
LSKQLQELVKAAEIGQISSTLCLQLCEARSSLLQLLLGNARRSLLHLHSSSRRSSLFAAWQSSPKLSPALYYYYIMISPLQQPKKYKRTRTHHHRFFGFSIHYDNHHIRHHPLFRGFLVLEFIIIIIICCSCGEGKGGRGPYFGDLVCLQVLLLGVLVLALVISFNASSSCFKYFL